MHEGLGSIIANNNDFQTSFRNKQVNIQAEPLALTYIT
jgi:hypothetical protein